MDLINKTKTIFEIYDELVSNLFGSAYFSSNLVEKANKGLQQRKKDIEKIKSYLEQKMLDGDSIAFAIYQVRYNDEINKAEALYEDVRKLTNFEDFPKKILENNFFSIRVACIGKIVSNELKAKVQKGDFPPTSLTQETTDEN